MNTNRFKIATLNDIEDGQMQIASAGEAKILLARVEDQVYATSLRCTHSGAALTQGVLHENRVVCPWHNACFDLHTGEQTQPPGLDNLASFPVEIQGEDIYVELPEPVPEQQVPKMVTYNPDADKRTFVVLGAGAAGMTAVETLRQQGFEGRIILISKETRLPYDRTKLSKKFLQGSASENSLPKRSCEFYQEYGIELQFGQAVTKVDPAARLVRLENGVEMNYDALLVATGGAAVELDVPGSDLKNISKLRNFTDADELVEALEQAKRAVVVGSSFIGMEVAASLSKQDLEVTVVSPDSVPFEDILGSEVGAMFQKLHEENGVKFVLEAKATEYKGNGKVEAVLADNGQEIPADLVVVGVGVKPVTYYLEGVELEDDQSIRADEYLQIQEGLYGAGDVVTFPLALTGEATRIEHWRLAMQHGRIAARNMLGQQVKFCGIPFFWTGQFGNQFRYAGHAESWDEVIIHGELNQQKFLAFYVKGDQILAVFGCNRDQDVAAITELMRCQKMPKAEVLKQADVDWIEKLKGKELISAS